MVGTPQSAVRRDFTPLGRLRSCLLKEVRAQIPQAGVHDHSRHGRAPAESRGYLQRGNDVCAGRCARENRLFTCVGCLLKSHVVRIVLDTNDIVSGLLDDWSAPAQVLDLCLSGYVDLVLDGRILAEYREVLRRPRLKLDPRAVDQLLDAMRYAIHVVGIPLPFKLPDPDDQPFLECAVAGGVDALVTGNTKHFRLREGKLEIPILSPRQFLNRLAGG